MRLAAAEQGAGQGNGARIALQGQPLDGRPSGIAEAEYFRGLVERFAERVVDSSGEALVAPDALDAQDLTVPAGDQQ